MKKVICVLILIVIGIILGCRWYKGYRTVSDMATDTENTIITGMHYEDDLKRYKYLVIPDANFRVNTMGYQYEYSKVTDIGERAFEGNSYIKTVYIPANITRIRSNAFNGCTSIQSVSYAGTEQQWKQIVIDGGNEALISAPINYNEKMPAVHDQ